MNTYIGARYVPIFGRKDETSIQWDNTKPYEPLTVVLYQGNSYTSRQAVPVGIDILNEEFWALTGNYNAQVEQYRTEVSTYDGRITANADAIAAETAARELADDALHDAIDDEVDNLEQAIQTLGGNLGTETENRQNADTTLQDNINAEALARGVADTDLDTKIDGIEDSLSARIDALEGEVETGVNNISIISPAVQGSAILIKHEDNSVLLDVGYTTDVDRMTTFLTAQGITKLDAIVISHFHNDHCGGFEGVKNFIDSNTDIFIQMEPLNVYRDPETDPNHPNNYENYVSRLATLNASIQSVGGKAPITPTENQVVQYGDIKLRFNNLTLANRTTYENTYGEGFGYNSGMYEMNNYSIITTVDIKGFKLCYAGDIEAVGQRLNYDYIEPVDIAFTTHHIAAWWGYLPFYQKLSPKKWCATTSINTWQSTISLSVHWILSLIMYNYIDDVYMAHNRPLIIDVKDYTYLYVSGESLVEEMARDNLASNQTYISHLLPPTYTTDDVYAIYSLTLKQLVEVCAQTRGGSYTLTPTFAKRTSIRWVQDISECLYGENLDQQQITVIPGRVLHIIIHQNFDLYADLYVYQGIDIAEHKGYYLTKRSLPLLHHFDTPLSSGVDLDNYLNSNEMSKLLHSETAFVVLANGITVPLLRTGGFSGIQNATQPNIYSSSGLFGMYSSADLTEIYRFNINTAGVLTAVKRTLADNTVTDVTNIQAVGIY